LGPGFAVLQATSVRGIAFASPKSIGQKYQQEVAWRTNDNTNFFAGWPMFLANDHGRYFASFRYNISVLADFHGH
jgi:hypothetical protein